MGIFENNCPNPFINPPNREVSIFILTIFDGIVGINVFPVPYPNCVNINPIIAVVSKPKNTAPGKFFTKNIKFAIYS